MPSIVASITWKRGPGGAFCAIAPVACASSSAALVARPNAHRGTDRSQKWGCLIFIFLLQLIFPATLAGRAGVGEAPLRERVNGRRWRAIVAGVAAWRASPAPGIVRTFRPRIAAGCDA